MQSLENGLERIKYFEKYLLQAYLEIALYAAPIDTAARGICCFAIPTSLINSVISAVTTASSINFSEETAGATLKSAAVGLARGLYLGRVYDAMFRASISVRYTAKQMYSTQKANKSDRETRFFIQHSHT